MRCNEGESPETNLSSQLILSKPLGTERVLIVSVNFGFWVKTFDSIHDKSGPLSDLFVDASDILPQDPNAHELDPAEK